MYSGFIVYFSVPPAALVPHHHWVADFEIVEAKTCSSIGIVRCSHFPSDSDPLVVKSKSGRMAAKRTTVRGLKSDHALQLPAYQRSPAAYPSAAGFGARRTR